MRWWRDMPQGDMRREGTAAPRASVVVSTAAIATSALLVARITVASGDAARLVLLTGLVGLALQAVAVLVRPVVAGPAAVILGSLAASTLAPQGNSALAVEMVVLFLAATELAGWAVRLRSVVPETRATIGRQVGELATVVAAGGAVSAAMLGVTRFEGPAGRVALVLGSAAAVAPVAVLAARRWRSA